MSAPAEICDACGKTITDEELETGAGISVLGKSYCPTCKDQAVKDISLEDLAAPVASRAARAKPAPPPAPPKAAVARPAAAAPPPPRPPIAAERPKEPTPRIPAKPAARVERAKEPAPAGTPRTPLKPATRRKMLAARRGPHPAIFIGIGAAAVAVILAIVLTRGGGGTSKKDPSGNPDPSAGPGPKKAPLSPEAAKLDKAEQAYLKVVLLSRQPGIAPVEIIAATERAWADCAGTPFEEKLAEVRNQAIKGKESVESARGLEPLIAELRSASPADTRFARYAELTDKFMKAKEIAIAAAPDRIPELNRIRQEYVERYEEKSKPYLEEIEQTARVLADERRYDDALAKIETFPRELRLSGAWRGLELLKQDIERRKKLFPPKK